MDNGLNYLNITKNSTMPIPGVNGDVFNVPSWESLDDTFTVNSSVTDPAESALNVTGQSGPKWEPVVSGVVLSIIVLLTVGGNTLVISSVFTYKPLRIPPNFFIVSLAMTDITLALVVMPIGIPYIVAGRWMFSATMCQVWGMLNVLCCSASMLHLCVIAMDRYLAIKKPITYAKYRTPLRVLLIIGAIWLFSMTISSLLLFWEIEGFAKRFEKHSICTLASYDRILIALLISCFYATLLVTTIMYVLLFITMRVKFKNKARIPAVNASMRNFGRSNTNYTRRQKQSKALEQVAGASESDLRRSILASDQATVHQGGGSVVISRDIGEKGEGTNYEESARGEDSVSLDDITPTGFSSSAEDWNKSAHSGDNPNLIASRLEVVGEVLEESSSSTTCPGTVDVVRKLVEGRQRVSQSRERRLARTLALIMGVFAACWLPFFMTYLVVVFCDTWRPSEKFELFATWLGYVNSSLNPIIFTVFNVQFRNAFKHLLRMNP